jgi:hypothetical protein
MAGNTNWVFNRRIVTDRDSDALEAAKRIEQEKITNGYRWIKINEKNKILVPCNEDGSPTKEGLKIMSCFKKHVEA